MLGSEGVTVRRRWALRGCPGGNPNHHLVGILLYISHSYEGPEENGELSFLRVFQWCVQIAGPSQCRDRWRTEKRSGGKKFGMGGKLNTIEWSEDMGGRGKKTVVRGRWVDKKEGVEGDA